MNDELNRLIRLRSAFRVAPSAFFPLLPTIPPMQPYLIALGIFALRICDVSVGTVRVIYTIRGHRLASALMGVLESGIWIFAISKLFKYVDNPISMLGWALGFGF